MFGTSGITGRHTLTQGFYPWPVFCKETIVSDKRTTYYVCAASVLSSAQGSILLVTNPGVANSISGLACAASYQSGIDRHFLWQRRNETVPEYGMTVQQVSWAKCGPCRLAKPAGCIAYY